MIFHLHSKNEENDQYKTALVSAYEKEIEAILKDASNIVNRQKEALEKAKEGNSLKLMIKEIEEKHIQEKRDTQRTFEEYKQKVKERET